MTITSQVLSLSGTPARYQPGQPPGGTPIRTRRVARTIRGMSPPLLGRARELAELSRLRGAALAGGGSLLLLAGEAGIGKTAVLRAFAGTASGAGTAVLASRCIADEGAPAFWPLRRVLDAAGGLPPALLDAAPALRDLGPELLDMTDAPPAAARFLAIERTVRALLAAAGSAGLVVTLDDLPWADDATVRLLHYLHGELPGSRLLVVVAAREVTPALAELHAPVLRLVPLTEPDVAAYLSTAGSAAGSAVDPSWPAYVHGRTGGNPLFLRELTRVLVQEDRLGAPATPLSMPTELRRMVGYRTDRLGPACRRLLGGASAIGEEFDTALLASADGGDPGTVSDLLAEAIDAGVLVDEPDTPDRLRFAHGLARQARYDELSRAERVEWHRRIAAALQAGNSGGVASAHGPSAHRISGAGISEPGISGAGGSGSRPADEIARHLVRAAIDVAGRRAAVAACRAAATEAARALDVDDAAHWNRRAVDLLDGAGYGDAERAELLLDTADTAYRAGQVSVALAHCAPVVDLAERLGRPDLAARAALVVRGIDDVSATDAIAALCTRARRLLGDTDSAAHAQVLAQHEQLGCGEERPPGAGAQRNRRGGEHRRVDHAGDGDGGAQRDPTALGDAVHARQKKVTGPEERRGAREGGCRFP